MEHVTLIPSLKDLIVLSIKIGATVTLMVFLLVLAQVRPFTRLQFLLKSCVGIIAVLGYWVYSVDIEYYATRHVYKVLYPERSVGFMFAWPCPWLVPSMAGAIGLVFYFRSLRRLRRSLSD